jgi:hypothetical protein
MLQNLICAKTRNLSVLHGVSIFISDFSRESLVRVLSLSGRRIQVVVFWVETPCNVAVGYQRFRRRCCLLHPKDGVSKVLRNVSILLLQYTSSQPRIHRLERNALNCLFLNPLDQSKLISLMTSVIICLNPQSVAC